MTLPTIMLLSLPVLLVFSGFFSGSETALFSLSRHERVELRASGTFAGMVVTTLLTETRSLLITLLLSNMTVNVLYFVVSTKLLLHAREQQMMGPVALGALSIVPLISIIILGEVLPKLIAARSSVTCSRLAAVPLLTVHRVLAPVRLIASGLVITPLARLIAPSARPESLTPDELATLLEQSQRRGVIDPQEQRMLRQVLELGQVKVDELMTPRVDIEAFDLDNDPAELIDLFKRTNLRHVPAYRGNLDHIEGFIRARRALLYPPGSGLELNTLIEPATFVPQQQRADQLLTQLRREAKTIAVVVDEYGGTAGLITLKDVVEEIVGDFPNPRDEAPCLAVQKISDVEYLLPGDLPVREWAEAFDIKISHERVSTFGGLVTTLLGKIPQPGDTATLRNLQFTVEKMRHRRVSQLCVKLTGGDA
ncbi:MAG: HlyC/CorC family transporter [Phycisphaerae bacterium]|nr:HlyC/CorC family transporter [Phycisphaerae bacterium]